MQDDPFDHTSAPDAELHLRLARQGAAVRVAAPLDGDAWVVTDPELARAVLCDPRFVKDPGRAPERWRGNEATLEPSYGEQRAITTADGPEHIRIRRMHSRLFTATRLRSWAGVMRETASSMLHAAATAAEHDGVPADLMRSFSYEYPLVVIGEMLGVPRTDLREIIEATGAIGHGSMDERLAAITAIDGLVRAAFARMAEGTDSIVSELQATPEFAELGLSEPEFQYFVAGLVFAGHETTGAVMGSLVHRYLATSPPGMEDPATRESFVAEVLRLEPPSTFTLWRFTAETVELAGNPLAPGTPVLVDIESCNINPHRRDDPLRFAPGRPDPTHLSFGHGPHSCIAFRMALQEMSTVLEVLRTEFPAARLESGTPRWMPDAHVRRLAALPVVLRPEKRASPAHEKRPRLKDWSS